VQAVQELKDHGALRVFACITHPLFSGPALDRIASSVIDKLLVSDTIPLRKEIPSNIQQISIAPLIAEAIQRASQGHSLKDLALRE
jgi:ribose-phosphate pyrophosphokinase